MGEVGVVAPPNRFAETISTRHYDPNSRTAYGRAEAYVMMLRSVGCRCRIIQGRGEPTLNSRKFVEIDNVATLYVGPNYTELIWATPQPRLPAIAHNIVPDTKGFRVEPDQTFSWLARYIIAPTQAERITI
jgi:hypothetical protein